MNRTRILLADEHVLLTDVLSRLLTKHFDVIGVARDGQELIRKTTTQRPDVVIAEVSLPVMSGIEAARAIRREAPRSKLLFLTMYDELSIVQESFDAGALGYVLKSCAAAELIKGIHSVAGGTPYVSPGISEHLISPTVPSRRRQREDALTQRRREVLQMIAQGMTMKEIGLRLGISTRTAETHKYVMMRMLGVSTKACLIRYAIRTHVVQETPATCSL